MLNVIKRIEFPLLKFQTSFVPLYETKYLEKYKMKLISSYILKSGKIKTFNSNTKRDRCISRGLRSERQWSENMIRLDHETNERKMLKRRRNQLGD